MFQPNENQFKHLLLPEDVEKDEDILRKAWNDKIAKTMVFLPQQQIQNYSNINVPQIVEVANEFIKENEIVSLKNAHKSGVYRDRGNQKYARQNLSEAGYLYTMAIIHAPNVSESDHSLQADVPKELSLAFANRSAVFHELAQYDAALTDIEHALATGYPSDKRSKILLRKVECLIALARLDDAKCVWEQLYSAGTEPNDEERITKIRLQLDNASNYWKPQQHQQILEHSHLLPINPMFSVIDFLERAGHFEPSPTNKAYSTKIEIHNSQTKGRHMVAKSDIKAGEIIVVESPFAGVLDKWGQLVLILCHHCFRKLEMQISFGGKDQFGINGSPIPCTQCTRVLYCSNGCRNESWQSYHQYECPILPLLYEVLPELAYLAFRMILITGLDTIQQVIAQKTKETKQKESLVTKYNGANLKTKTATTAYEHVYKLIHYSGNLSWTLLTKRLFDQTLLVQLAEKCGFICTPDEKVLFGESFQRHFLQLKVNAFELPSFRFQNLTGGKIGAVIYPHSSFVSHSCDPNTESRCWINSLKILRATKPICAGTEITTMYLGINLHLKERQEKLRQTYRFECDCSRCLLEARDGLDGKYFPISCKKCGSTFERDFSSSNKFRCPKSFCSGEMSLSKMKKLYTNIEALFVNLDNLKFPDEFPSSNFPVQLITHFDRQLTVNLEPLLSVNGKQSCRQLTELYSQLSKVYISVRAFSKAREYLLKSCELEEMHKGKHTVDQCKKYMQLFLHEELNGTPYFKRTLELIEPYLQLVDVKCSDNGDRFLDEHLRFLLHTYRRLIKLSN